MKNYRRQLKNYWRSLIRYKSANADFFDFNGDRAVRIYFIGGFNNYDKGRIDRSSCRKV